MWQHIGPVTTDLYVVTAKIVGTSWCCDYLIYIIAPAAIAISHFAMLFVIDARVCTSTSTSSTLLLLIDCLPHYCASMTNDEQEMMPVSGIVVII